MRRATKATVAVALTAIMATAAVPLSPVTTARAAERLEVDVSTHTVSVNSAFSGTEIIVFGTVVDSVQASPESGYYDVVVLVEGKGAPSIVRQKSNVGGLWINTTAVRFDNLPLYTAIATTRPLEEIAERTTLVANVIGFGQGRLLPGRRSSAVSPSKLDEFRTAAIRLKQKDGLYVRHDYAVAFIGPALFRASVKLPANIPVGPLDTRVFLFHDGQMIAAQRTTVMLERSGLDRLVYDFAFDYPLLYGILTVAVAALAGLAASAAFSRRTG